MNLNLSERQKEQIEQAAVQSVIADMMKELIEARVKQIKEELAQQDVTLTPEEVADTYLGSKTISVPQKSLLVPAH